MPAYIIARVDVTDMDQYREYMKLTPAAIEQYGGRFIARGGEIVTLEGPEETNRVVIVEFPTFEQAKAFYASDQYQAAKALRVNAATASFIAIDGAPSIA